MIFYDLAARLPLSIHFRALEIDWAHGQFGIVSENRFC